MSSTQRNEKIFPQKWQKGKLLLKVLINLKGSSFFLRVMQFLWSLSKVAASISVVEVTKMFRICVKEII